MKLRNAFLLLFLSLCLVASRAEATPYSDAILADNPVVYYNFDEAAGSGSAANSGSSGATYNATGVNNPTFGGAAHNANMGTSVNLNTTSHFDLLPGNTNHYTTWLNTGNTTMEFWINTTQTGGGGGWNNPSLMGDDNGGCCGGPSSDSWWGVLDAGGEIGVNAGNNPISAVGATPVNDGEWHHIALARDGSNNVDVYVDGVLDGSGNMGNPGNTYKRIGQTDAKHLDAMIDELAIFDSELTPEQIGAHFAAATAAPAAVPEPASIAIWTLLGLGCFGYYRSRRKK